MIASLMMYSRPEIAEAEARFWGLIRAALADRAIDSPAELSNDAASDAVWLSPDLVLSQTCGMPLRTRLRGKVHLVGTPDYGLSGCPPGYYRSAIVVRADDPRTDLGAFSDARFAYNDAGSQSGFAAPYSVARQAGFWFGDRVQSFGHVNSARMVADKAADIAALDAMTWLLIQRHDAFAADLRVLMWTPPTPGLPYITGLKHDPQPITDAMRAAITALAAEDRTALCLNGLVQIPQDAYLAVPNPPADAG